MRAAELCLISTCLLMLQLLPVYGGSADPDDFRKMTAGVRKKCIAETKATLEMIEGTEYGEFPDDNRLKCYFKCALEKFNMMDKNGRINYNLLKKMIPDPYKEIGNDMVDSCNEIDATDKCEKAFNFMRCMFNVNPMVNPILD
ncbi:Pheromone-binding protein-related protein 1 [Habropoda laboriosa]|uniref:Pheromone-binding protein-related protein 1 n=1 Tax=Habropoda laboriosa TaxID=597456 RepID=A0A0L7RJ56_9HYME|nr:Pheromone-binding protein-related protein 1 [Habropoda laboriosa]